MLKRVQLYLILECLIFSILLLSRQCQSTDLNELELFKLGQHYRYSCETNWCAEQAFIHYDKIRQMVLESKPVKVDFDYGGMLNDLGLMYSAKGQLSEAIEVLLDSIKIAPQSVAPLVNLAGIYSNLNEINLADDLYLKAIQLTKGESPVILYNYGVMKFKYQQQDAAKELWEATVRLDSNFTQAWSNLASIQCHKGNYTLSRQYYDTAINVSIARSDYSSIRSLLIEYYLGHVPIISPSETDVSHIRRLYADNVYSLLSLIPSLSLPTDPEDALGCSSLGYYLIYHGYEDLGLRQLQAALYWHMFSTLRYKSPHLSKELADDSADKVVYLRNDRLAFPLQLFGHQAQQPSRRRIKVGFVSAFFYRHSVGLLLQGVVKGLSADLFDVYMIAINLSPKQRDHITDSFDRNKHAIPSNCTFISLSGKLPVIRDAIADLRLDVLVYGELGMDALTYFLSFSELSRRSVFFWGHATSSGVTNIGRIHEEMMKAGAYETVYNQDAHPESDAGNKDLFNTDELLNRVRSHMGEQPSRSALVPGQDESYSLWPDYFVSSILFEGAASKARELARYTDPLCPDLSPPCDFYAYCVLGVRENQSCEKCLGMNSGACEQFEAFVRENVQFSQLEYSERLVLMNGLTTYFEHPVHPLSNADLHLINPLLFTPSDALPSKVAYLTYLNPELRDLLPSVDADMHLYGIPQTLYKLHPDFDDYMLDLLLQNDEAYLVLPAGNPTSGHHLQVMGRLQQSLHRRLLDQSSPMTQRHRYVINECYLQSSLDSDQGNCIVGVRNKVLRRVLFVRSMSEREYLTLCAISDVVLDPFPVGGGRSSLEIFSVGTPIVMIKTRTSILQLTYAMYVTMGITLNDRCCVAYDRAEYVQMALFIGRNHTHRDALRQDILRKKHLIYENKSVLDEWEKLLLFVHAASRPEPRAVRAKDIDWAPFSYINRTCVASEGVHCGLFQVLASNPLWREDELTRLYVNHPYPPLILNQVELTRLPDITHDETNACYDVISMSSLKDDPTSLPSGADTLGSLYVMAPRSAIPFLVAPTADGILLPSRCSVINSPPTTGFLLPPVFQASFSDVHMGSLRSYEVRIDSSELEGDAWRGACLAAVRDRGGVADKLKILFACAIVGRDMLYSKEYCCVFDMSLVCVCSQGDRA